VDNLKISLSLSLLPLTPFLFPPSWQPLPNTFFLHFLIKFPPFPPIFILLLPSSLFNHFHHLPKNFGQFALETLKKKKKKDYFKRQSKLFLFPPFFFNNFLLPVNFAYLIWKKKREGRCHCINKKNFSCPLNIFLLNPLLIKTDKKKRFLNFLIWEGKTRKIYVNC